MIFSRSNTKIELPNQLTISNVPIDRKHEARFLGVIMDEKLNWSRHITTVISKMARYVGIMCKIKKFLPLSARIQIYHSFVQSHINFCSLVWGFSSKTNIEAIFSSQKKGIRAVIPGFIYYKYKDGHLPGHTKSAFSDYSILTIQSIIVQNTLIFMNKTYNYPSLIPLSVRMTISAESPMPDSTYETCENWLKTYNDYIYRNSLFFKGPLLYNLTEINFLPTAQGSKKKQIFLEPRWLRSVDAMMII